MQPQQQPEPGFRSNIGNAGVRAEERAAQYENQEYNQFNYHDAYDSNVGQHN